MAKPLQPSAHTAQNKSLKSQVGAFFKFDALPGASEDGNTTLRSVGDPPVESDSATRRRPVQSLNASAASAASARLRISQLNQSAALALSETPSNTSAIRTPATRDPLENASIARTELVAGSMDQDEKRAAQILDNVHSQVSILKGQIGVTKENMESEIRKHKSAFSSRLNAQRSNNSKMEARNKALQDAVDELAITNERLRAQAAAAKHNNTGLQAELERMGADAEFANEYVLERIGIISNEARGSELTILAELDEKESKEAEEKEHQELFATVLDFPSHDNSMLALAATKAGSLDDESVSSTEEVEGILGSIASVLDSAAEKRHKIEVDMEDDFQNELHHLTDRYMELESKHRSLIEEKVVGMDVRARLRKALLKLSEDNQRLVKAKQHLKTYIEQIALD
jgi:hypothetical protein